MKNDPKEVVISDLETKYQEIETERNDKQFYLAIAGYGSYILNNNLILTILKPLYSQAKKDIENYINFFQIFYEEWSRLAKDLIQKAAVIGIQDDLNHPNKSPINFLEQQLKDGIFYHDNYIPNYFTPYYLLINKFINVGKKDIISEHYKKIDGNYVLKIEEKKRIADEVWEKYKNLRINQTWWAHYQILRLTYGIYQNRKNDPYFDYDNVIDVIYKHEFEQVAYGQTRDFIYLKRHKYQIWIRRLHNFIISRLKNFEMNRRNLKLEEYKLIYYQDNGLASYRGEEYIFKGKSKALLSFLYKSKNTTFSLKNIIENCNPELSNPNRYFKTDKDTRDCINYTRNKLKVKTGEFFPIQKRGNCWIWIEK